MVKEELATLIALAKKVLWSDSETRKAIQEQGVNIIPANFYSNIPLVDEVLESFEYREPGAQVYNSNIFDQAKINDFMQELLVYAEEFTPPTEGDRDRPQGFFWGNPAFSYADAMSYYCIIRHFKPRHIVEIGAGFSTLVADEAIRRNGFGSLTLIEPFPKKFLRDLPSVGSIIEKKVQDIPLPEIIALVESANIWFIDSTHTVKVGSDCLYIYLQVMPAIANDIIVHTHDVFLPYGIPKGFVLEKHIYWTEQYLLYAYMLDNPKIDVLFGSSYAKFVMPEMLETLMGGKYPGSGGSLWYRLNGRSGVRQA